MSHIVRAAEVLLATATSRENISAQVERAMQLYGCQWANFVSITV